MSRKILVACGSALALATSVTAYAGTTGANAVGGGQSAKAKKNPCRAGHAVRPHFSNPIKLSGGAKTLSGAGATFPAPVYSVWTAEYAKQTGVQVAYQSIGSGGGVAQIQAQTVDFGQSDVPMTNDELDKAKGGKILHVPVTLGGVVPTYNLKDVKTRLRFDGETLGRIYGGQITKWNDPVLKKLNPGVNLPNKSIAVVHRSDGSGTTGIWTDYLRKTSKSWVKKLGGWYQAYGKTVAWPVGIGGKGNEGVSGVVGQTDGALGYVELAYALGQHLQFGDVKNRAGNFVHACVSTVSLAAAKGKYPTTLRTSLTNEPGDFAYPITGTSYALVYLNQTDKSKAVALIRFLSWTLTKGQDMSAQLNYSPLGVSLWKKSMGQLYKIKVDGKPVVPQPK